MTEYKITRPLYKHVRRRIMNRTTNEVARRVCTDLRHGCPPLRDGTTFHMQRVLNRGLWNWLWPQ